MKKILTVVLCAAMILTMVTGTAFAGNGQVEMKEQNPPSPLTIEVPNLNGGTYSAMADRGRVEVANSFYFNPITVKYNGVKVTDYEVVTMGDSYFRAVSLADGRFKLYPVTASSSALFYIRYDGVDYEFQAKVNSNDVVDRKENERGKLGIETGNYGEVGYGAYAGDPGRLGNGFYNTPVSVRFNLIRTAEYEVTFDKEGYFDLEYLEDGRFKLIPLKPTTSIKVIILRNGFEYEFETFITTDDVIWFGNGIVPATGDDAEPETGADAEEEAIPEVTMEDVVKDIVQETSLSASSSKVTLKNGKQGVKITVKAEDVKDILKAGYTVEYHYYRSTKKGSGYGKALKVSDSNTYTNTSGKKGTKYYYKAAIVVKDEDGEIVSKSGLKQCKYAARTW